MHIEKAQDELRSAWFEAHNTNGKGDIEVELRALVIAEECIRSALAYAAWFAKDQGFTWNEIGAATLVHESTARLRWGSKAKAPKDHSDT